MEKDIVIIGAGLTGLTCAYYLNKRGKDFVVLEKNDRVGGVINTKEKDGFIYETGPNTGVLGSNESIDLFNDIKDSCKIEIADANVNKRYILKDDKWVSLPSGLISGISTKLFTFSDKLRLLGEPFRAKGNNQNESLSELVKRRMGKSFLDYAVDPFISGVYAGNPDLLITKFALPKLYNLEQNYGSFIYGSIKKAKHDKNNNIKNPSRKIFSVNGGLKNLTESLYMLSGKENFHTSVNDMKIKYINNKFIIEANNYTLSCNQLISTIPSYNLSNVLDFIEEKDLMPFNNLEYAPIISIAIGLKKWAGLNINGFGGLVPFKEKKNFLGVLFISSFLKNRTPKGSVLINVFIGGTRKQNLIKLSDDEIIKILKEEIAPIMGLKDFSPDLLNITRYEKSIPQYYVDSECRFEKIKELEKKYKGLVIAGNLRDGIGMADRIKQGKNIADSIL